MLGTVTRAGRLLDLFTADTPEWGPTAVARELGIAKSQAYELLTSLSEIGLLRRSRGGRFRLGWRTLALGRNLLRTQFPDTVANLVRSLAHAFGEPVQLMALDRDRLEVIASRPGSRGTDQLLPTEDWYRYVARCAAGKCLLAGLPNAVGIDVLRGAGAHDTPEGPRALDSLFVELELIRHRRIAIDEGAVSADLRGVAVPIRDVDGETLAALGIWTIAERWQHEGEAMSRAMVGVGRRIETELQTVRAAQPRAVRTQPTPMPIAV